MSLIKRAMVDAFVAAFQAALPPSAQINVAGSGADWEEPSVFPALRIIPSEKFKFDAMQDEEIDDTQPDKLLVEVGDFEGSIELRVIGRNRKERETVEELVMNVLLSRDGAPGVMVAQTAPVSVGGYATLYSAPVTMCLGDEEWRDEMVMDRKRFSFMTLDAYYPALVMKTGVYPINQLILAFNEDLNSDVPEEASIVNDDGSMTPTTP
jgi:hypothetical protein